MSDYNIVLRGGTLVDGTGAKERVEDVAIDADTIVAIGENLRGRREIDCTDLIVAPGFIDTHSHSDLRVLTEPQHLVDLAFALEEFLLLDVLGFELLELCLGHKRVDRVALRVSANAHLAKELLEAFSLLEDD